MTRRRERWLLLLAYAILGVGYFVVWQSYPAVWRAWYPGGAWQLFLPPAAMLAGWCILSGFLALRRCRETLALPIVALLVGLGLLFLLRLAGGVAHFKSLEDGAALFALYHKQLISFAVGWVALAALLLAVKDYRALSRYKYLIALVTVGLLLATSIMGKVVGGQTLTLNLGFVAFQPNDPVKLLLVVFLAAYLAEKHDLLSVAAGKFGLLTRMDFRYMGPLVALWLLVMAIILRHNDMGALLLLFTVLLGMLYLGTERKVYLVIGCALALLGAGAAYQHSATVQQRVAIWQDPWRDASGNGYQIAQALMALGNGRVVGAGLAGGAPERIPFVQTDIIYAAISEDLGLLGAVAFVGLYLVLIGRLFHVGLRAGDRFGQLLAAGLALTLAVQTWVILAGVVKLIPLTGITLPFVSYGGTSLLVNLVLVGLVLKVAEARE